MPSYFRLPLDLSDPLPMPSARSLSDATVLSTPMVGTLLSTLDIQRHRLPQDSTDQTLDVFFQNYPQALGVLLIDPVASPAAMPVAMVSRRRWTQWRSLRPADHQPSSQRLMDSTERWHHVCDYVAIDEQAGLQDAIDCLLAQESTEASEEPVVVLMPDGAGVCDRHRLFIAYTRLTRSEQIALAEPTVNHLRRQQELILNAIGEGVYGVDLQGHATFVNPAAAQMIGWHPQELLGQSMHQVLHHSHPDHRSYRREDCPIYAAFQDGIVHRVSDEVFWRKDGTCFPVEYISTPIRDEQGQLVGAVVVFRDITQRKWAEALLHRTNEELEHRVRDRTTELQQANEQLKELSELRSRVVTMVCHEFRNPLNNILLSVSSLGRYDHQLTVDQKSSYLLGIQDNVERMTQMIDAILIIGRVEAKGMEVQPRQFDLIVFCQDVVSELLLASGGDRSPVIHENRVQLTSRHKRLIVTLDQCMVHSILTNILSNALRYTPESAPIQFKIVKYNDQVTFHIADSGIGIPAEDIPYVFEPFHRGRNVSNIAGTGLGLNIVKRFVDLQGGHIDVSSQLGKGTVFQVVLPLHYDQSTI
ncbi:ATP-binding protein [Leptolyngbya sp. CCY15150]|uniref:PAS domain-containing sensor histidine kinase n=1 Tax=Leptolyngbya sp. CCY15150 TaxID=2767772 RepID=UPI001EF1A3C2|nr:ATP-binding protein [Leptolyngbya sp. CCY15150]